MADSFVYGDRYSFDFVRTVSFEDEPEFDPSGVDRLHNRYRITIQAVISGVNSPGLPAITRPGEQGEATADILARIREDLMAPRQYLYYAVGGKKVIEVKSPPDAANGPFPINFRTLMTTPGSITVEFTVEARTADCSLGKNRGWSSNRWEQSDSYDKLGYCTTRTTGILVARSDMRQANPDEFRDVVTPPIRNGFQPEDWSYTISPDGLRLSYSFDDKEFYLSPPLGALDWGGEFSTMTANGINHGMCTVWLKGAKGADKAMLWRRANEIALSKLLPLIVDGDKKIPISQVGFRENLNAAEVEVSYRIQLEPKKVAAAVGQLPGQGGKIEVFGSGLIGTPLPGLKDKNQPGIAPPIRGNHPLIRLVSSIFHDPCYSTTEPANGGPLSSPGNANKDTTARPELGNDAFITVAHVSQNPPPPIGSRNNPAGDNYSKYKIRTTYLWNSNTTVLVPTDKAKKVEVVSLGPPILYITVDWVAESTGRKPVIPSPCPPPDVCGVYELLDEAIDADSPTVSPTGELTYKMYGCYQYVVTDPSRVSMSAPLPPFLASQVMSQENVTYDSDSIWKFMTNRAGTYTGHWERCGCDDGGTSPGQGVGVLNGVREGGKPGPGIPIPGFGGGGGIGGIPPNWLPPGVGGIGRGPGGIILPPPIRGGGTEPVPPGSGDPRLPRWDQLPSRPLVPAPGG